MPRDWRRMCAERALLRLSEYILSTRLILDTGCRSGVGLVGVVSPLSPTSIGDMISGDGVFGEGVIGVGGEERVPSSNSTWTQGVT